MPGVEEVPESSKSQKSGRGSELPHRTVSFSVVLSGSHIHMFCFAIMIFLAMRKRRRHATAELAPSSTAYTNTSRYTPDNSSSAMSDMKATYVEELSPNVSSSDLHPQEVVLPMDGHLTIIGSYEEFLDVPTGARPNILQCLPVSPTMHTETVTRTIEMTDPELAFTPRSRVRDN